MTEQERSDNQPPARTDAVRNTGLLILLVLVGLAFGGMGMFMYQMGRDMSEMTRAVSQMGLDVSSMAADMEYMVVDMDVMAESIVDGTSGMSVDLARVRQLSELMAGDMHSIHLDMDDMSFRIRGMAVDIRAMDASTARMTQATGEMTRTAGRISVDMDRMTRPESLIPMTPFR